MDFDDKFDANSPSSKSVDKTMRQYSIVDTFLGKDQNLDWIVDVVLRMLGKTYELLYCKTRCVLASASNPTTRPYAC